MPAVFLILGSASPALSRQASESLAGRVALIEMEGFGIGEIPRDQWDGLWHRGGFPRSFLAEDDDHLFVVYPGDRRYPIRGKVTALPFGTDPFE